MINYLIRNGKFLKSTMIQNRNFRYIILPASHTRINRFSILPKQRISLNTIKGQILILIPVHTILSENLEHFPDSISLDKWPMARYQQKQWIVEQQPNLRKLVAALLHNCTLHQLVAVFTHFTAD